MTRANQNDDSANASSVDVINQYVQCYVAFLDILGFTAIVNKCEERPEVFKTLAGLTAVTAKMQKGMKETKYGKCPMQTRAFSDSIVIFTPVSPIGDYEKDPVFQLLFYVRHIHDKILELDTILRGGIAIGKMYWNPDWNRPKPNTSMPITFGRGVIDAYRLESGEGSGKNDKEHWQPCIRLSDEIVARFDKDDANAHPFAEDYDNTALKTFVRKDANDGFYFLDIMHRRVLRRSSERVRASSNGFAIYSEGNNSHGSIVEKYENLIAMHMNSESDAVKKKYQWIKDYIKSCNA